MISGETIRACLRACLAIVAFAAMAPSNAFAQSVWGGTGATTSTSNYNTGTNWSTGTAPIVAGSSARFGGSGNTNIVVNPGPIAPDSWTFLSNSKSYVVTGGTVHFGTGIVNNASSGQSISISNNMTGTSISQAAASTLTLSGTNSFTTTSVTVGTLVNSGSLTSATSVGSGGTLTTSSTLAGGLTNSGIVNASGTVNGAIVNQNGGTFNVTGTLSGNSTFDNNGAAQLFITGGNFSGLTTLTNNSTAAIGITVNSGFTLSTTNTIVNNSGATISNGGTLTATNGVTNQASGTLATTGTINGAYSNRGTTNAQGTISGSIVNQGSGVFNVTGDLAGNSFFNNNNTAQLFVSGGNLSGITTLRNDSTAGVGIDISASRGVTANAVINSPGATIEDDGTLTASTSFSSAGTVMGTGTIVGSPTFSSGGIFAPGNGTAGSSMIVTGNLAFQSGAVYLVQVSPATASLATVSGTATLAGATVGASFASGSYVSKQYTILNAGSISGTFDPTIVSTGLPAGFSESLSYDLAHVYLNLALHFTAPGGALNVNQQNAANAIVNYFNRTGSVPAAFGSATASGLTQMSGETATGTQQTTFDAMGQFLGVMTSPFIGSRNDGAGAGSSVSAYADDHAAPYAKHNTDNALDALAIKAPRDASAAAWSTWASGFGGSQTTNGNASVGSNKAASRVYGEALGADYRVSPSTLAGFSLAGGGTNFTVANGGSGRSDLFQVGAFVRHEQGPAYITAAFAYGWQDVTTNRTVTVVGTDQLRARFNANAFAGRLETGARFVMPVFGGAGVTPYAAGQFTTVALPSYMDSAVSGLNTFALAYGSTTVTDPRSELGLRTDKSFVVENAILTLRGRAAWAHDYNTDRAIAATFQTLPGSSFVVIGAAQASDATLVTASAEMKWMNGWSAAATFDGEFSNVTQSYAGKGVARYQW